MTHLIETTKAELTAIKEGALPFYHVKKGDKPLSLGDKVIFQEGNDEHPVVINHIHEANGVAKNWVCLSWKDESY
jgi:hypothetical protein